MSIGVNVLVQGNAKSDSARVQFHTVYILLSHARRIVLSRTVLRLIKGERCNLRRLVISPVIDR